MQHSFKTSGVCSARMDFSLEDGRIRGLKVVGGCSGNLRGIARLVEGRDAAEVAALLRGVRCESKRTSCPDQLARALDKALAEEGN